MEYRLPESDTRRAGIIIQMDATGISVLKDRTGAAIIRDVVIKDNALGVYAKVKGFGKIGKWKNMRPDLLAKKKGI